MSFKSPTANMLTKKFPLANGRVLVKIEFKIWNRYLYVFKQIFGVVNKHFLENYMSQRTFYLLQKTLQKINYWKSFWLIEVKFLFLHKFYSSIYICTIFHNFKLKSKSSKSKSKFESDT